VRLASLKFDSQAYVAIAGPTGDPNLWLAIVCALSEKNKGREKVYLQLRKYFDAQMLLASLK